MEKDLFSGALSGSQGLVKQALAMPSTDVNSVDKDGRTAVFLAAREGREDIVQLLLDAGANINLSSRKDGDTPLIIACSEGHVKVAQKLLSAGASVNGPNSGGWTPLLYAAYYGHKEVVELLLANGANINQVSKTGCSALYRACTANRAEMVQLLVDAGADVNLGNAEARSPLGVASWYGYTTVARTLLEAGADVDTFNHSGCTPLHEALENEHYEVIELLLTLGQADPALVNSEGVAPLALARSERAIELIRQALQAKQIRDNLKALQQTQPQLTQLMHTVKQGAENSYAMAVTEGVTNVDDADGLGVSSLSPQGRYSNGGSNPVVASVSAGAVAGEDDAAHDHCTDSDDHTSNSNAKRNSARRSAQLSTQVLATLHSLAQASPLTIECLKQFGASAAQAELEYARIRKDPSVYEYYLFFIQSVSSAVMACQTIASGFVDDARMSASEQIMEGLDTAAQAVSWMGVPLVTGIARFIVGKVNQFDRQRTIRRITTYFPSVDSHKYIEILAREMCILVWKEIHQVLRETKKASKRSILDRVMRVVEWMDTATNLSVVQGLACGHASKLIDAMMESERPFAVEYQHLPQLLQWATDLGAKEIESRRGDRPSSPVSPSKTPGGGGTLSSAGNSERVMEGESVPGSPSGAYAEKEEVDERINLLQQQLSQQQQEREAAEAEHKRDLAALKKQMKSLEAVNQIFSGAASGGLVNAQSAEQAHKALGEHLSVQAQRQDEQAMAIRELAVRVELLIEDNNLRSPERVEVSGGTGGSAIYSSNKGPVMGDWVNSKSSRTADSTGQLSPTSPRTTGTTPQRGAWEEIEAEQVLGTGGCCAIS